jgi:hypothetical protein
VLTDADEIPADEDFQDPKHPERPLSGRLFLVLTNQDALRQLLSLWNAYRKEPDTPFQHGLNKWRHVFSQLRAIRPWGAKDRLNQTGARDDWTERLGHGQQNISAEQ